MKRYALVGVAVGLVLTFSLAFAESVSVSGPNNSTTSPLFDNVTVSGTVGSNIVSANELQGVVWKRAAGSTNYINLHNVAGIEINAGESGQVVVGSGTLSNSFAAGTAGSGTGYTTNSVGIIPFKVHKITVTEAALDNAATSDEVIWIVQAKTRVIRVIADVTQTFSGGGITDMDVTCGTTAGGNQYLLTHDVDTAIGTYGDVAAEIGAGLLSATVADIPSWSATTSVQCRFTCVGANCTAATQGSVTYYIEHLVYP